MQNQGSTAEIKGDIEPHVVLVKATTGKHPCVQEELLGHASTMSISSYPQQRRMSWDTLPQGRQTRVVSNGLGRKRVICQQEPSLGRCTPRELGER